MTLGCPVTLWNYLSVYAHPSPGFESANPLGSFGPLLTGSHSPGLGVSGLHAERPSPWKSQQRNINLLFQ